MTLKEEVDETIKQLIEQSKGIKNIVDLAKNIAKQKNISLNLAFLLLIYRELCYIHWH